MDLWSAWSYMRNSSFIVPLQVLLVMIDVGTNNQVLLENLQCKPTLCVTILCTFWMLSLVQKLMCVIRHPNCFFNWNFVCICSCLTDMGLQHPMIEGDEYISLIDEFMEACFTRWSNVIVQVWIFLGRSLWVVEISISRMDCRMFYAFINF